MSVLTRHSSPRTGDAGSHPPSYNPPTQHPAAQSKPGAGRGGRLARWSSAANVVAGAWLLLSPFVLDYGATRTAVVWNSAVIGLLVVAVAGVKVARPRLRGISWLNVGLGSWLILSPLALADNSGFVESTSGNLNMVIVGMVVLACAAASSAGSFVGAVPDKRRG